MAQAVAEKQGARKECGNPFEMMGRLVELLFKTHGEAGVRAYDEFVKLATKKGIGKYEVYEYIVEIKEDEVCITTKPGKS